MLRRCSELIHPHAKALNLVFFAQKRALFRRPRPIIARQFSPTSSVPSPARVIRQTGFRESGAAGPESPKAEAQDGPYPAG